MLKAEIHFSLQQRRRRLKKLAEEQKKKDQTFMTEEEGNFYFRVIKIIQLNLLICL